MGSRGSQASQGVLGSVTDPVPKIKVGSDRRRWVSEFQASLVFRENFRTDRDTKRNPVSKSQKRRGEGREEGEEEEEG